VLCGGADACFKSSYAACACGTIPRRGPLAALPGADMWWGAWGDGAQCPCEARRVAFNDHMFASMCLGIRICIGKDAKHHHQITQVSV
jgi:hypothetical protein